MKLSIRQAPLPLLLGVVLAHTALDYLLTTQAQNPGSLLLRVEQASNGLASAVWITNLLLLLLIVGGLVFGLGKLRPRDIGLDWRNLPYTPRLAVALENRCKIAGNGDFARDILSKLIALERGFEQRHGGSKVLQPGNAYALQT